MNMNDQISPSVTPESPSVAGVASLSGSTDGIDRIPLALRVVVGRVTMPVSEVARLRPGSLVKLDRTLGEPVDILVGDRLVCQGEIGVTDDRPPRFVVKITEFVGAQPTRNGR